MWNRLTNGPGAVAFGQVLVAFGAMYIQRPALYRRGIWTKTSLAIRFLSEQNYIRYMRALGGAFILIGLALIVRAAF